MAQVTLSLMLTDICQVAQVTLSLVRRAEEAGFLALVLTVDAPLFGKRRRDARNKFKLPDRFKLANFVADDDKSTK